MVKRRDPRDYDPDDPDADLRTGPGDAAYDAAQSAAESAADAAAGDAAGDAPDGSAAPLCDELDLHTFLPKECADVVAEYVRAAQEAGMTTVRIVHGKGSGTLRRIVHSVLASHPAVRAYRLADERGGSWG